MTTCGLWEPELAVRSSAPTATDVRRLDRHRRLRPYAEKGGWRNHRSTTVALSRRRPTHQLPWGRWVIRVGEAPAEPRSQALTPD